MISNFQFSVPSKVILFGEHAANYGYSVIASAIDLRMILNCSLEKSEKSEIRIKFNNDVFNFDPHMKPNINENSTFQMYRNAFYNKFPDHYTLNMNFTFNAPSEAGLGSSAALCTLVAATVMHINNEKIDHDLLFSQAKDLENYYHEKSSGIDVATVINGSSIKMNNNEFKQILLPKTEILIVDSGITRETKKAVNQVSSFLKNDPNVFKPIIQSLGAIADSFYNEINQQNDNNQFFKRYFPVSQNLLSSLNLSCPEIDAIVDIAKAHQLSAKLSGAGMGGIVLVVGEDLSEKQQYFSPFQTYLTHLGADGFRVEAINK